MTTTIITPSEFAAAHLEEPLTTDHAVLLFNDTGLDYRPRLAVVSQSQFHIGFALTSCHFNYEPNTSITTGEVFPVPAPRTNPGFLYFTKG
jgi:hypothetical protein